MIDWGVSCLLFQLWFFLKGLKASTIPLLFSLTPVFLTLVTVFFREVVFWCGRDKMSLTQSRKDLDMIFSSFHVKFNSLKKPKALVRCSSYACFDECVFSCVAKKLRKCDKVLKIMRNYNIKCKKVSGIIWNCQKLYESMRKFVKVW